MAGTVWINAQAWGLERLAMLSSRLDRRPPSPPHLLVGLRGEREALLHLRRQGYTVVARRWTTPRLRGDLDLVAWDGEWLCFVEVKTRSERSSIAPAEAAVDTEKRRMLRRMAQIYLRGFPEGKHRGILVRFDVIAVYLGGPKPEFELFQGAFAWR